MPLADVLPLFMQVSELLPDSPEDAAESSHGVSVSDLQQLLNKGLAIQLQLESLQQLQNILRDHQTWELRMHQFLQGSACSNCASAFAALAAS